MDALIGGIKVVIDCYKAYTQIRENMFQIVSGFFIIAAKPG